MEPNIHPILVHYTLAFASTAAILYLLRLVPNLRQRQGMTIAADWMLFLAAGFVIATIAAGFEAYYSVAHDGPSHEAMTTHRNWAVPSGLAVLAVATWRWLSRKEAPGGGQVAGIAVAGLLVVITAWWGGQLVYSYGLGVKQLPESSGNGHDHDHGGETSGDHEDDGHDGDSHADQGLTTTDGTDFEADLSSPNAAVKSLAAAYATGQAEAVRSVLSSDVLIAEGGKIEDGFAAYAGHHLPADLRASQERTSKVLERKTIRLGTNGAAVITRSRVEGTSGASILLETALLEQQGDAWSITHLHWSFSAAPAPSDNHGDDSHEH
ncbi:DUF2231 domain-containing protein [Parvularcula sp. ZS-1/3]|uniref:DUF2231 domain-containing protein n=1 Tax=Parvularcula mediterranea TaxID=2732508 RepID=A0A7Y3RMZ3_9PROT|nr:DUF2231 domain-containing protein [Parvularcula mediterranea]